MNGKKLKISTAPEVSSSYLGHWLTRLYNLRRDKRGSYERPHKPALILAILNLMERGVITENKVFLSDQLIRTFRHYFEIVKKQNDQPTIQNPFFFLSGDDFWKLVPRPGEREIYEPGHVSRTPSVAELHRRVAYGRFDEGLWTLLKESYSRHQLREALVARYFPEHRIELAAIVAETTSPEMSYLKEDFPKERDTAFRRTILEIYDYRCSACGIRVVIDEMYLVEAAHLIPFSIAGNDRPDNGIALCPNHHWAMDRNLISPCPHPDFPAGIWSVSPRLDDRIDGQKDLLKLADLRVIPPSEEKFYPAQASLVWRQSQLTADY